MAKSKTDGTSFSLQYLNNLVIQDGDANIPPCIPTGYFHLDFAIRYGRDSYKANLDEINYDPQIPLGLPLGKLVQFYGAEGGGKSSLAYRVAGNAHKLGYTVAWIDAEQSYSKDLALINGCDLDKMLVIKTSENDLFAERVIDVIEELCYAETVPQVRNGKKIMIDGPKVVILDSLASIIPKRVEENSAENQNIALLPRLLSQNLGKILKAADKRQVLLIFINQLRKDLNKQWGDDDTYSGGYALKHASSLILKITKRESNEAKVYLSTEEGEKRLIGRRSLIDIKKNRFGPPYDTELNSKIDIPIYYETYFPDVEEILFDVGRQLKLISIYKMEYRWNGVKIEGKKDFIEELKKQNLIDKLVEDIKTAAKENNAIVPPEINLLNNKDGKEKTEIPRDRTAEDSAVGETDSKKRRGKKGS